MDDQPNTNRYRNTYLVLIGAGVFLLLNKLIDSPGTIIALFMLLLGVYSIRSANEKKGYILLAAGTVILIGGHFMIILAVILMSLGFFYIRSRQVHGDGRFMQKQKLIESLKWDKEPWVLRSMSLWNVIGEMNFDLSLAFMEEEEVTIMLQGVIGDIDIIVPEDFGLDVQSSVFFGQLDVVKEKEAGLVNKIYWRSPNYEKSEQRVKLIVSYIVGDIDIKVI